MTFLIAPDSGEVGLILLALLATLGLVVLALGRKRRPACPVCYGALQGPICTACGNDSRVAKTREELHAANNEWARVSTRDMGLEDRD